MANDQADVVICGGGVIGAAIAYYLVQRGLRPVVVEADAVGSGASGAAAGLLSPPSLAETQGPLAELLRVSFDMHEPLARVLVEESGVDYSFGHGPRLLLAFSEEDEKALRQEAKERQAAGLEGRWLDPSEVRDCCDWIDRPVRGALMGEDPGQLDPYRFTLALITAAERGGATVRTGRVSGIEMDGNRVSGVRVGDSVIATRAAVIAMGPWSGEAGDWLGMPVPIEPLKGQIVRVRPPRELTVCGFSNRNDDYVMPKLSGLVYLGTTMERVGFDLSTTTAAREQILAFALEAASVLGEAEVVEQTACLRPLSYDEIPIMGTVPGVVGAYVATGHGRKGILMATASGQAMAELIVDGRARCLDMTPFDPARFALGASAGA